jgi:hypothetical protein
LSVVVSDKKQLLFAIILIAIAIVVVELFLLGFQFLIWECDFVAAEIYPNIDYFKQKQICLDYQSLSYNWGLNPYNTPNQKTDTYTINNFGFRGDNITFEKPNNTYRIFLIGGSTGFGWGSTSDQTTISGYIQQEFDNANLEINVEVINAGITGTASIQETYRIKNSLFKFNPDMIIVYGGLNDMGTAFEKTVNPQYLEMSNAKIIHSKIQTYLPFYKTPSIIPVFLEWISFHLEGKELHNRESIRYDNIDLRAENWNMRQKDVCNFGKEKNFETVIVLQPILGTGDKILTEYEKNYLNANGVSHVKKSYDIFAEGLKGLEDCAVTADFRNIFDGNTEFLYYDGAHLSDRGNEIVAKEIMKIISPGIKPT